MDIREEFPECYPDNFFVLMEQYDIINNKNILNENTVVYRVAKNGILNKQTFFSSYEEYIYGLVPDKDIDLDDLQTYSTSFDTKKSKIKRLLKMFNKNYPKALLIEGTYRSDMGVALKTIDWKENYTSNHHVDWWIYRESLPENLFKECLE